MEITFREEEPGDADAIRQVNEQAFGQPQEARLVDMLRANQAIQLSLVALVDRRIVGHILFSAVRIESAASELEGSGLGPMAVIPELQRRGIGSQLVLEGTKMMRERGAPFIVVLGHPEFYPRFGFVPASRHGVACPWKVPDEVFMLLPLDPSLLRGASGVAQYRDEFAAVT